jgi:arginine exporter protein ArgO
MIILRFVFYFSLSFSILCIPIGDQSLFILLQKKTAPIAKSIYQTAANFGSKSLHAGKVYGTKLFSSSTPVLTDSVKESSSANTEKISPPQDQYSDEERAMIKNLTRE